MDDDVLKFCFGNVLNIFAVILLITSNAYKAGAQTDPAFPLVNVPDTPANVEASFQKTYVTTIGLIPVSTQSTFIPATFISSAAPYYSSEAGLQGYVTIDSVTSSVASPNLLMVTYNVRYTLAVLEQTPGISDALIKSTIGDYFAISNSVGSAIRPLASFYVFPNDNSSFTFTGVSVCGQPTTTCNSSQTQCSETLGGVSVTCTSPCKLGYCHNNGTCAQTGPNAAPTCNCLSKSDVWFLGERCQTMVALWMVILVIVLCFFLIVAVIIAACCFYAAKKRKKEKESELFSVTNTNGFTNKAFVDNEAPKAQKEDVITRNGYQERSIDAAAAAAASRRRSRTPSDGRRTRSRRRRSRSSSADSRRRRSYGRRRSGSYERRRNRRDPSPSNSSVSSFDDDEGSFDDDQSEISQDDVVQVTAAAPLGASPRRRGSSSSSATSSSETPTKRAGSQSSNDVDVRDQGTSPIRWVATNRSPQPAPGSKLGKIDIAARKGWTPSLGPQMFEIAKSTENLPSGTRPSPYIADTYI